MKIEKEMTPKIAVITGGSSGLGLAMAKLLGKEGYWIIILARNKTRIGKAIEMLTVSQIKVSGISCDVTDAEQLRDAASAIKDQFGKIDFLILNAGSVSTRLLVDYPGPEELKSDIENDLWGTIQSAYFLVPLIKDGSRILMTSSGFGLMGSAGYSAYCAAKAGIINFGESLRRELLYRKIGVYVSVPGDMDTPQFAAEIAGQPQWMKEQSSPRKLMSTDKAAKKILDRCNGHTRFLIQPSCDVRLLIVFSKLLPRRLRDKLIDGMFPRPGRK
jgi:3-dehydrosphinganine reductase